MDIDIRRLGLIDFLFRAYKLLLTTPRDSGFTS